MDDYNDACAVLRGKKQSLEKVISAYDKQLSLLKSQDSEYRIYSNGLNRELARYLSEKETVDREKATYLLHGEFDLPSKFVKIVSGARGIGIPQKELNRENLRNDLSLQRKISGFDRRTQNVCIAIAKTNDELACLNKKFGGVNLKNAYESQTLAGLRLQLIKTSQELATLELKKHKVTLSGLGAARVAAQSTNSSSEMSASSSDGISCAIRRFCQ